jgi:hypothetical protein
LPWWSQEWWRHAPSRSNACMDCEPTIARKRQFFFPSWFESGKFASKNFLKASTRATPTSSLLHLEIIYMHMMMTAVASKFEKPWLL